MMEVFMLVEKKRGIASYILFALFLGLTIIFGLGAFLLSPIFSLIAILLAVVTWLTGRSCIEYEYSYFDGEVRFTKIKNKSKRKKIAYYNMDETVIIAPAGDRSVYNYESNNNTKVKNLTSGNPDAKIYTMVTKGEGGMELVKFEPDEEFLNAVCKKYAQKVRK